MVYGASRSAPRCMTCDPATRCCVPSRPSLVVLAHGRHAAPTAHIPSGHTPAAVQVFQAEYNLMCDIASCPVPYAALCPRRPCLGASAWCQRIRCAARVSLLEA